MYPEKLLYLIQHFESLSEPERRDELISLADSAPHHAPLEGQVYDLEDVRKDTECSDTVGIHLQRQTTDDIHLAISLGCKVQTLTRALTTILCRGLSGASTSQIVALPDDFIERIVGEKLVQLRARTIYYVLHRVQAAAQALEERSH
jgi:cysteine desulfuration protein SufE